MFRDAPVNNESLGLKNNHREGLDRFSLTWGNSTLMLPEKRGTHFLLFAPDQRI